MDPYKTTTVDIYETLLTLGVEAARKSIIVEIIKTVKGHSLNIDKRHLILLADILTSKGNEAINIYICLIIYQAPFMAPLDRVCLT